MADILSQEEIDALLDVVDDDSDCYFNSDYPFWALSKFKGKFEVKEYTRDSLEILLKALNIYRDDTVGTDEWDHSRVTTNNSFDTISRTLKEVGYHLVIVGTSEKNITVRLREEQRQREFLKDVDNCINDWVEDHPQHLI